MMRGFRNSISLIASGLILLTACNMPAGIRPADASLSIQEPAGGASYRLGEWVRVRTSVAAADGAVTMDLLVDGQVVRSDELEIALYEGTMLQLWRPAQAGTYSLHTRLTTPSGAVLDSNPVVIQVGAPASDPITPSSTSAPADVENPTPTPTLGPPIATADQNAFCRLGPSQAYTVNGELLAGASSPITGRNSDATWWVIGAAYGGGSCWISDSVVTVSGDTSNVPVVEPPPLPPPAPTLISPAGLQACTSHVDLTWAAVDHPDGIARYEWEVQGPGGAETGNTTGTSAEYVTACGGASYKWRVRAVSNEGAVGPYSGYMEFEVQ